MKGQLDVAGTDREVIKPITFLVRLQRKTQVRKEWTCETNIDVINEVRPGIYDLIEREGQIGLRLIVIFEYMSKPAASAAPAGGDISTDDEVVLASA